LNATDIFLSHEITKYTRSSKQLFASKKVSKAILRNMRARCSAVWASGTIRHGGRGPDQPHSGCCDCTHECLQFAVQLTS
jgi:hypothetical protein